MNICLQNIPLLILAIVVVAFFGRLVVDKTIGLNDNELLVWSLTGTHAYGLSVNCSLLKTSESGVYFKNALPCSLTGGTSLTDSIYQGA